jgi:signal transduction histidine kinase
MILDLERINSKILLRITLLVIVEIILIVGSFGVIAYFQSQQSSLGNSINRYLTAKLQLQTERYLDGTSDASQLKAAMNGLQSNIIQASVNIKDTGSGIQPEIMPKLFSKFVTNSSGGTGIGLFISKSIVEAHGGRIWAENNADGEGATFTFSLPLSKQI